MITSPNDLPDDATVRDVLGGRKIIEQDYDTLPASIPNTLTTTGARFDALPEKLQHRIAFGLGGSMLSPKSAGTGCSAGAGEFRV